MWRTDDRLFGMEDRGSPQTPYQEAISVICVASVLVGLGCYGAALNEVPFVSAFLFTVASQVYHRLPVLNIGEKMAKNSPLFAIAGST